MGESSTLKLIIEKGPREGETLEYLSGSVIKIGRIVRGNTIGIKDAGISSKHICIQFDNETSKWTLTDLDSSNGTILNGETLSPNVPSALKDSDCIKIGELTSITVKIYDDLGENTMEEPVQKRNLRSRGKKVVESLRPKRTLRSSKKEEKVDFIPTLNQILEDTNSDVRETEDQIVNIESKVTRGRKKKLPVQPAEPADIVVPVDAKRTRRGRRGLPVEPLEEVRTNEPAQKDDEEIGGLEKLNAINESAQEPIVDQSLVKRSEFDNSRWEDLEKMRLGDFFDYLEYYLPKEIRDKREEIISQLPEKARKYKEVRLQKNEKGKCKEAVD